MLCIPAEDIKGEMNGIESLQVVERYCETLNNLNKKKKNKNKNLKKKRNPNIFHSYVYPYPYVPPVLSGNKLLLFCFPMPCT
jgi:hypothetical protein